MNDLHFEWRERLEEKHKKQLQEYDFLAETSQRKIRKLETDLINAQKKKSCMD